MRQECIRTLHERTPIYTRTRTHTNTRCITHHTPTQRRHPSPSNPWFKVFGGRGVNKQSPSSSRRRIEHEHVRSQGYSSAHSIFHLALAKCIVKDLSRPCDLRHRTALRKASSTSSADGNTQADSPAASLGDASPPSRPRTRLAAETAAALRRTAGDEPTEDGVAAGDTSGSSSTSGAGASGSKKPLSCISRRSRLFKRWRCDKGSHVTMIAKMSPSLGQCHCSQALLGKGTHRALA